MKNYVLENMKSLTSVLKIWVEEAEGMNFNPFRAMFIWMKEIKVHLVEYFKFIKHLLEGE